MILKVLKTGLMLSFTLGVLTSLGIATALAEGDSMHLISRVSDTLWEPFKYLDPLDKRPASAKIKNGVSLVAVSPLTPVVGAGGLIAVMSFIRSPHSELPPEFPLYGGLGAVSGAAIAPVVALNGSAQISVGAAQLSLDAVRKLPELKPEALKSGTPANIDSSIPRASLVIRENGQRQMLEIPLDVNLEPVQFRQKISLDE